MESGRGAAAGRAGRVRASAPLAAAVAVGRSPSFAEPWLAGGRRFWLERRPQEEGRTTLMAREGPALGTGVESDPEVGEGAAVELTPGVWNLRSRVHEYGGGVYAVEGSTVVFVHDGDRCLWRLELPEGPLSAPPPPPQRLTPPPPAGAPARAFADGLIDRRRQRWVGVMEQGERDFLVAVPLAGGEPQVLLEPADFCGYATADPTGTFLAWVEWQRPAMPWDRSQLWLGRLNEAGRLVERRAVAGSDATAERGVSVFQPLWAGADLVVANDRSGWWNLECLEAAGSLPLGEGAGRTPPWRALLPQEAEFACPQWTYGLRTTAWDGERLVAAACRNGRWELGCLPLRGAEAREGTWQPFAVPFDDLAGLAAGEGRVLAIAASPLQGGGLLEVELPGGAWHHRPAAPCPLPAEAISRPEALWFKGYGGRPTHAWYYPPAGGSVASSPLLVRGHSGPTGMARTGLSLEIQFWTSRGWGVVDVNYGGSTGFGRAYRQRLEGGWGVVDVADCAAAAEALVAAGRAAADRVAMEGGSAAGFTVLEVLAATTTVRAGACRYAVTDLGALAQESHRFEERYLDRLVGPWPGARETYEARSPLRHPERIQAPVIFFQGLDDRVVPPAQTERMALALSDRGVPVEVHLFPGEGHGFRDGEVRRRVLEATEGFFSRHFGLRGWRREG